MYCIDKVRAPDPDDFRLLDPDPIFSLLPYQDPTQTNQIIVRTMLHENF